MTKRASLIAIAGVSVLLAGARCSNLGAIFQKPELQFRGLQVNSIGFDGASLDILVDVYNPNSYRLALQRFSYDLAIENVNWGLGSTGSPMASAEGAGSLPILPVAGDVARFVRAWPRQVRLDPPPDGMTVCTLEGLPRYTGKLVLVDGCLRFQPKNSASPGPLVLTGAIRLSRDAENYLSVGSADAPPEYRLRVGERGGVFIGVGCSMDAPVPAPPQLAKQCGANEMIRRGTIKSEPVCSAAYLERRRKLQRQERQTGARLRADRDACIRRTGAERGCPPAAIPASPELFDPPCRLPAGAS